ncbi:DUF6979 family protein [Paenibacillus typhae]|uniref:Uncharacterized protein n=1 Tax=Paenibacillus typhae TaxID=1174501 RepID=A0A1G8MN67_9BACL|nr:hypothetical protein [Paenibacillus typhae]SDI69317.1 hypothetical protein SAMN05216192_107161 [Paenibacillus typhae]
MNKYGVVTIKAVELLSMVEQSEPLTAWNAAASDVFVEGTWTQRKGCPKNAFLGLCEDGLVRGIPKGNYTYRSDSLNKAYAVQAVKLLKANPELASDRNVLWKEVMKDVKKSHNSQMDVVLALWKSGLIVAD